MTSKKKEKIQFWRKCHFGRECNSDYLSYQVKSQRQIDQAGFLKSRCLRKLIPQSMQILILVLHEMCHLHVPQVRIFPFKLSHEGQWNSHISDSYHILFCVQFVRSFE